jgi:hypothetical protein
MGKNAVLFGGNWNDGANSGSRFSNWNNAPTNSNNNIGARGVCEGRNKALLLRQVYGLSGRPFILWSAMLSRFGKYLWGSGIASSSRKVNDAASMYA